MMTVRIAFIGLAAALAACGRSSSDNRPLPDSAAPVAGTPARQDTGGMSGMGGMQGMSGTASRMMEDMQNHMRTMMDAAPDSMKAMMPMHRQMAANLLSTLTREMRDMNMPADAKWSATVDSLRQDLSRMPDLSGGELRSFLTAHQGRLMRLMEMHRSMMGNKKP